MDKTISFIIPSRTNLKYLKWSYESLRKNIGYRHEICVFSDYSTDGTVKWCEEISKKDNNFKYIVNDGTWFGENKGELKDKTNKELINVFVPTTPNPTSGFLLMVPKKDLIYLDVSFEQASKFIVSAGTTNID